jgi:hypothetical protein
VQIIEAAHQPLKVADAVAVGIHIGADGEAIDDGVLVPEVVDHAEVLDARRIVIPAKAGIQYFVAAAPGFLIALSRLGNDGLAGENKSFIAA